MADGQVKQFIDEATQAIQGSRFDQALALLDQAAALDPSNGDVQLLRGVCLSQTNQPQAATEAFRQAVTLSPDNAKAQYNYAVHLYSQGQKEEALRVAQRAVEIEPTHSQARDLMNRIESELGLSQSASVRPETPGAMQQAPLGQPGEQYISQSGHSLSWVEKMGSSWTILGWSLIIVEIALSAAVWSVNGPFIAKALQNPQSAPQLQAQMALEHPGVIIAGYFSYLTRALVIGWSVADVVDRKANMLWLVPQIVCSCCGFSYLAVPFYMWFGRKK